MSTWELFGVDWETLDPVTEVLPATGVSMSRLGNGVGLGRLTVPLDLLADFTIPRREITAQVDGSTWHQGPIVDLDPDREAGTLTVTWAEASQLFGERVQDVDVAYNDDTAEVAGLIADAAIAKVEAGAPLPGGPWPYFTAVRTPTGTTKVWALAGSKRYTALESIANLAKSDPGGFRWRMHYGTRGWGRATRELAIASTFDLTGTPALVITPGMSGLLQWRPRQTRSGSANALHGLAQGEAPSYLRNDASFTQGDPLIERVYTGNGGGVDTIDMLRYHRITDAPPIGDQELLYTPTAEMPRVLPADLIAWEQDAGEVLLGSDLDYRVAEEVTVTLDDGDGPEQVRVTLLGLAA